ncbi:aldehyde oxidase 3-like [Dugong dugon]
MEEAWIPPKKEFLGGTQSQEESFIGTQSQEEFLSGTQSQEEFFIGTQSQEEFLSGTQSQEESFIGTQSQEEFLSGTQSQEEFFIGTQSQEEFLSGTQSQEEFFIGTQSQEEFLSGTQSQEESFIGTQSQEEFLGGTQSQEESFIGTQSQEEFLSGTQSQEESFIGTQSQEEFFSGTQPQDVVGVSAFRQAPHQQNALATVKAGKRVLSKDGTDTVVDLSILYGGVGPTTVSANKSCQQLIGRCWDEEMLSEACRLVLDEITLPGSAPGGMVEFRRTLMISFLFKFYLNVLQQLKMSFGYPDISKEFLSVLEDFPLTIPHGIQSYECVDPQQHPQHPVGRPIMHKSDIKHATGEAVFCDDMPALPEELFLAVVTSTRPHAKFV